MSFEDKLARYVIKYGIKLGLITKDACLSDAELLVLAEDILTSLNALAPTRKL